MDKPRLQIIRGLPGSGKSTIARIRYGGLYRLETDFYFQRNGEYKFTDELNKRACKWFLYSVSRTCFQGLDFVVTGVFAAHTERLSDTIQIALDSGYEVWVQTLVDDFGNIHNVPQEHLDAMREAFVSDEDLHRMYADKPDVHFGLMKERK